MRRLIGSLLLALACAAHAQVLTNPIIVGGQANFGALSINGVQVAGGGSAYNPASVGISGGTIDGTSIGATTASSGKFTTLNASGAITPSSTAGIVGTITNNSAQAGSFGEYVDVNCGYAVSGASISFTNASPTVGTWASPPWNFNSGYTQACPFQITANAPTGLATATQYWLVPQSATTFKVASSAANALAGTFLNTSATSSTANLTSSFVLSTTVGGAAAAVSLTAGDWTCTGVTAYIPGASTSITNLSQGIGTSPTALGSFGSFTDFETAANVMTATNNPAHALPMVRQSLSATTSVYQVALATFTVSTLGATGDLQCRRMR